MMPHSWTCPRCGRVFTTSSPQGLGSAKHNHTSWHERKEDWIKKKEEDLPANSEWVRIWYEHLQNEPWNLKMRTKFMQPDDDDDGTFIDKPPILKEPIYHPRRTILQARA
jgi:hypothetical protein